jgi:hypothetical protein
LSIEQGVQLIRPGRHSPSRRRLWILVKTSTLALYKCKRAIVKLRRVTTKRPSVSSNTPDKMELAPQEGRVYREELSSSGPSRCGNLVPDLVYGSETPRRVIVTLSCCIAYTVRLSRGVESHPAILYYNGEDESGRASGRNTTPSPSRSTP